MVNKSYQMKSDCFMWSSYYKILVRFQFKLHLWWLQICVWGQSHSSTPLNILCSSGPSSSLCVCVCVSGFYIIPSRIIPQKWLPRWTLPLTYLSFALYHDTKEKEKSYFMCLRCTSGSTGKSNTGWQTNILKTYLKTYCYFNIQQCYHISHIFQISGSPSVDVTVNRYQ